MAPSTAIKKCTVCKNPVKGHLGRAGKGNCTMKPFEDDEDVSSRGKRNIVEVLESQRSEGIEEEATEKYVVEKDVAEKDVAEKDVAEKDVEAEPWEDVSTSPLPCEQPAHLALKRTKNEAKRIHSKSDGKVDIREYVAGKRFVMCTCLVEGGSISPCECEGVLVVGEEVKDGAKMIDFPLVRDPLAKKNLKVVLKLDEADGGWSSDQPNVLNFKPSVGAKGIVVEGDIKLEMKRAVELVKGRRKLSVLWQLACTDVRIGFMGARFVEKDIVSPENVVDVTCRLWEMVEQTPGMWSPRPPGAEEVFHSEEDSLEEEDGSEEDGDECEDLIGETSEEVEEMSTEEESGEEDEDSEAASETLEETDGSEEE